MTEPRVLSKLQYSLEALMRLEPSEEGMRLFALGYTFGASDGDYELSCLVFDTLVTTEGQKAVRETWASMTKEDRDTCSP